MQKVKVLLGVRPKMLAEVIRNMVESQPDMEIVSEVLDPVELLLAASTTPVDVVVVAPLNPKICHHVIAEHPQLKVVALAGKGDAAFLYGSGPCKKRIVESSESSILDAMRTSGSEG